MAKSILVADADDHDRQLLCKLLQIFGYTDLIECQDGAQALEQLAQRKPDVIMLDLSLPKLDGLLITDILHHVPRFSAMAVVLMAPKLDAATLARGVTTGAFSFLEKPPSPEGVKTLLNAINSSQPTFPEQTSMAEKTVLIESGEAARATLNLLLGEPSRIVQIEAISPEEKTQTYDVVGSVLCSGTAKIEFKLALSASVADALVSARKSAGPADQAVQKTTEEFLMAISNRFLSRMGPLYQLTPAAPLVFRHANLSFSNEIRNIYAIQIRIARHGAVLRKQFGATLFVGMTL